MSTKHGIKRVTLISVYDQVSEGNSPAIPRNFSAFAVSSAFIMSFIVYSMHVWVSMREDFNAIVVP
jgi:hypothetical protein